jgi:hypothetical protein
MPPLAFAPDEPSNNHSPTRSPGNKRHRVLHESPSPMNNANLAGWGHLDSYLSLAQALDNRNAPAPPAALPPGRARVARGSYTGTFPYVRGLTVLRLNRPATNSFTTLETECAAVLLRPSDLVPSGGIRIALDRSVTARQWASHKTARPIVHSIHEPFQPDS